MLFRSHSKRHPIWKPDLRSRVRSFAIFIENHPLWVLAALFLLLLAVYATREISWRGLIFEPFTVPKDFNDSGLTPEVVANRVGARFMRIEESANTEMKKDHLAALDTVSNVAEVDIPGTNVGMRAVVQMLRSLSPALHISGDIILTPNHSASINVYLTQRQQRLKTLTLMTSASDPDAVVTSIAKLLLTQVNPYVLAVQQFDDKRYDDSLQTLGHLTGEYEPTDRRMKLAVRVLWGDILQAKKLPDQAILKYKDALNLDPADSIAQADLGVALDAIGDHHGAIAQFDKAIALHSPPPKWIEENKAKAFFNWGGDLDRQHRYQEAAEKLNQAIRLDPNYASAYGALGFVQSEQGSQQSAIKSFRKALELDPSDQAAARNLQILLKAAPQ